MTDAPIDISLGRYARRMGMATIDGQIGGNRVRIELNLDRPSERYMYQCHKAAGVYEGEALSLILQTINAGETFFDVGAHIGYFSAVVKAYVGPTGTVVAFEPDPDNFLALSRNLPNGIRLNCAVGDHTGEAEFFDNLDNDGGNALWNPAVHPWNEETRRQNRPSHKVPMVRLDDYADLRPSVIKIDTEGAEVLVLRGATEVLKQPQLRLVVAEVNELGLHLLGSSEAELRAIMAADGFSAQNEGAGNTGVGNLFFTRL